MRKTFKFKLFGARRNRKLHQQINAAGLAYNHCIALHKRYYSLYHKHLNLFRLQKHLTKQKRLPRFAYLKEIGSQALQDVAQRIEKGYQLFFLGLQEKRKVHPPKFRKVRKTKSFTLKQAGWKLDEEHGIVYIQGQKYRYNNSRRIEGSVKTVTVKRDKLGDIYIYLSCDVESAEMEARTGKSVGFDFGYKESMLVAEEPEDDVAIPMFFLHALRKIRRASRSFQRKQNRSGNKRRALKVLERLHRKAANQRRDYHWHLAHELCQRYAVICIETINLNFMKKKHGKKTNDYGYGEFLRILEYVGRQYGTRVVKVDRFFPSTQLCSACGYQNTELRGTDALSIREWDCPSCGAHHDRDRNAATNIHREGLRLLSGA